MTDTNKKVVKENQIEAKSRIDSRAELVDPIDFSFKDLMNIEEINNATPRLANKKQPKLVDGKYASLNLKLGYNALKEIPGLFQWCEFSFANPGHISSLDLSFNCFSAIPDEIINFTGLKCLYLHGNKLINLADVEKLKRLKNLTSLTLHGNPIENLVAFRFYTLSRLPNLKTFNFSGISKSDRQTASTWIKSNSKPVTVVVDENQEKNKKKKSSESDEEN